MTPGPGRFGGRLGGRWSVGWLRAPLGRRASLRPPLDLCWPPPIHLEAPGARSRLVTARMDGSFRHRGSAARQLRSTFAGTPHLLTEVLGGPSVICGQPVAGVALTVRAGRALRRTGNRLKAGLGPASNVRRRVRGYRWRAAPERHHPGPRWIPCEVFPEGEVAVIHKHVTDRKRSRFRRRRELQEPSWYVPATSGPLRFDPTLRTASEISTPQRGLHLSHGPGRSLRGELTMDSGWSDRSRTHP